MLALHKHAESAEKLWCVYFWDLGFWSWKIIRQRQVQIYFVQKKTRKKTELCWAFHAEKRHNFWQKRLTKKNICFQQTRLAFGWELQNEDISAVWFRVIKEKERSFILFLQELQNLTNSWISLKKHSFQTAPCWNVLLVITFGAVPFERKMQLQGSNF